MDSCNCLADPDDIQVRYQYVADFFIALAYFSIPVELIYFVKKSAVFPYRWVLVQFGAFIVLCGATHLINMWTVGAHSKTLATVMTVAKILTAVVSCATALLLVHIIPDLLNVKTRELFLKNKADELDREMGIIRTQEETGRHVRMLTHEIRSTLDRHTILNTTLVELGKTLALEECALWMPTRNGLDLQLSHSLRPVSTHLGTVPVHHPSLKQVFNCNRAVVIPPNSPVALTRSRTGRYIAGDVVAVRVPLLRMVNFPIVDWPEPAKGPYALMVLMLPPDSARRWRIHELELVESVADQVAVALSHAAILEESIKARDMLVERNIALEAARREAETAVSACNDFLAVMNHEMRMPMHAIITLSSLLQEGQLTAEQRSMVDTILRNSRLLAKLIDDVLDLSKLEDGSFQLDIKEFNLLALFREVYKLVKPIAAVKQLSITINIAPDVPEFAVGDEKRLLQTVLFIIGNALKFTKEGSIAVTLCLERPEYARDPRAPEFRLVQSDGHFYIRVQVRDSGIGLHSQDIPKLFSKFAQADLAPGKQRSGPGLGLALCKRFVNLMGGHIWIESEGLGKGSTVTFLVRLRVSDSSYLAGQQQLQQLQQQQSSKQQQQHQQQQQQQHQQQQQQQQPQQQLLSQQVRHSRMAFSEYDDRNVLLVNQSGANQMTTKCLLERLGWTVTKVVESVAEVAEMQPLLRKFRLVLFDLQELDSDSVAQLKQIMGSERPVLLALTSNTDATMRQELLGLGFWTVLYKPVSLDKIRTVLADALARR